MKVLATTDGSECSRHALERLGAIVSREGLEVTVVSVYPNAHAGMLPMIDGPYLDIEAMSECVRQDAQRSAEEGRRILATAGIDARIQVIEGDAATVILDLSAKEHADLIVMGSHGRTGIPRFLLGSVSTRVVQHAHCSVLVVR